MSEGYECDRCGVLRSGSPDTNVLVQEGFARHGKQDAEQHHFDEMREMEQMYDICPACRNDLRRWFNDGGADITAFSHAKHAEGPTDE